MRAGRAPLLGMVVLMALAPPAQAGDLDKLSINGYTSLEFEQQIEPAGEGGGDPHGSLDADLFDLVFNFYASDKIRVAADLTWEHGAATEDNRGNVALEYGFIEYTVSDLFKVRAGKMFIPFGIYNEIHTAKPAFLSVKEPASTNKTERIVEDGFRFYPRWGAGLALHGDGVLKNRNFNYDVFLSNGEQENTNPFEEDDNGAKAVTGRFRFELTESLHLGNSFYYDKYASEGEFDRLFSDGVELQYTRNDFRLWAEVAMGWLKAETGETVKQIGFYIQPSYTFANGVSPYFRFERVDPNLDRPDDQGYDVIVGVNWEISRGFGLKLENNFFKGASESSLAAYPGASYNEIKAAVVLGF